MTSIRYGIFLRPDAATCWATTQLTYALKHQFGLISAHRFPPHVTLIGNLKTEVSATELIGILTPVFSQIPRVTIHNSGIECVQGCFMFNVNDLDDGSVNAPLERIAESVKRAVLPIASQAQDHLVTAVHDYRFWGHISLASHDLATNRRLLDEVGEFLRALPVAIPASFVASTCSLFAFESDWAGEWWQAMTWEHLHSWTLAPELPAH